MGTYVTLIAKPGCADQINQAYEMETGIPKNFLVYSEKVITEEIAFIHSQQGADQCHLRNSLNTTSDWETLFPILKVGMGQIKLSGCSDDDAECIRLDLLFVWSHESLFERIEGLEDARRLGFLSWWLQTPTKH